MAVSRGSTVVDRSHSKIRPMPFERSLNREEKCVATLPDSKISTTATATRTPKLQFFIFLRLKTIKKFQQANATAMTRRTNQLNKISQKFSPERG